MFSPLRCPFSAKKKYGRPARTSSTSSGSTACFRRSLSTKSSSQMMSDILTLRLHARNGPSDEGSICWSSATVLTGSGAGHLLRELGLRIDSGGTSCCVEEVAGCRAGVDLDEEPHPLLGEGERADRFLLKRRHTRTHGLSGQRAGGSFRQGSHDQTASHGGGGGSKTIRAAGGLL